CCKLQSVDATSYVYSFFYLSLRRPPLLTLFPTRRSSDLADQALAADPAVERRAPDPRGHEANPLPRVFTEVADADVERHRRHQRSEEHTSELQSLAYLVCRLLLEKKHIRTFHPLTRMRGL